MIASLYQSASCATGNGADRPYGAFMPGLRSGAMRQMANGRSAGSSRSALELAVPHEALAAHQVFDLDGAVVGQVPFPQRHLEGGLLHAVRIEADGDQDHVVARGRRLAVDHHLVVEGVVEGQPEMAVQRRMQLAQAVEGGDLGHDVAGRGEVPDADLVLLRIEIFLAPRQGAASQSSKPE